MGEPLLFLRLEGPLQSWGGRSRWDVRDTQPEPTKSGIVGLLGCALGYPVRDPRLETELDAGLRFGVRIDLPGRVMRDYQTISGFLPTANRRYRHTGVKTATSLAKLQESVDVEPATIESPRYYLEDASFLVVLAGAPEAAPDLLERCAVALQDPAWPLYLGRKACLPTRPIFAGLHRQYASLEHALRDHPWEVLGANGKERARTAGRPERLLAYVEVGADHRPREGEPRPLLRQDALRVNPARQYAFRACVPLDDVWPDFRAGEGGV